MLQKLRTVIYHVGDLDKAKEWYSMLTGIDPYFDEPFYVGFDINGGELGLDPDMEHVTGGNHTTSFWAVEDIQAAVAKAVLLNGAIIQEVRNVGGPINTAVVADPFGNHIGFISGA